MNREKTEKLEATVLAILLKDEKWVHEYFIRIQPNYFREPNHRTFFEKIQEAYLRGADLIETVASDETMIRTLQEVLEIEESAIVSPVYVLGSFIQSNEKRLLAEKAEQVIQEHLNDSATMLVKLQDLLEIAKTKNVRTVKWADIPDISARSSVNFGYSNLDKHVTIYPFDLIIIGARPRHGKTSFAINMIANMLKEDQEKPEEERRHFMIFTLEQTLPEFLAILAMSLLNRDTENEVSFGQAWHAILQRRDGIENEITEALEPFLPYLYVFDHAVHVEEIASYILSAPIKPGAVFIDYIALLQTREDKDNEERRIAHITSTLKMTAKRLEVPIIALTQITRTGTTKGEEKTEEPPTLEKLRYSGQQEQDASVVLLLYNKEQAKIDAEEKNKITDLEINIAKNRFGKTGKVTLSFDMPKRVISENNWQTAPQLEIRKWGR